MKNKQPLTLAQAKRNMIKSGLFAGAAVLVLIVATVAWFSSGDNAGVDEIAANVESSDVLITNFYKYIDENRDNDITNDEPPYGWVAVGPEENLNTGAMVPGQKSFYKVVVRSTYPNLQIDFNNIVFAGIPSGGTTELSQYLEKLNVEFRAIYGDPETEIGALTPVAMDALLGSSLVNGMSKTAVFDVNISTQQNENITIYYTLEMSSLLEKEDLAPGFNISIGKVEVVPS